MRSVLATNVAVKNKKYIYSECVSVALGIQHAMRMRHVIIGGLSGSNIFFFSHYLINGTILEKNKINILNIKLLFRDSP